MIPLLHNLWIALYKTHSVHLDKILPFTVLVQLSHLSVACIGKTIFSPKLRILWLCLIKRLNVSSQLCFQFGLLYVMSFDQAESTN